MSNLLIQQYGKYKREQLKNEPLSCLLDTDIDYNPHQIDAFCSAINALKTGGIILADEVGLGKTIEAGLVLKYVIKTGAKKILLVLPASLRKQWQVELEEKFGLNEDIVKILDRTALGYDPIGIIDRWLKDKDRLNIAITSYDFSSKLMNQCPSVKWDFIVIDEAHNLRNIFHGTKRAKRLYECTKGIPKILLTATPLQNRLDDLHGIVSFIDERIFGSEKAFNKQYVDEQCYQELKANLSPVLYRTLRKDVSRYMQFPQRVCRTFDFALSPEEIALYQQVNEFLKKNELYCLPTQNRNLITLVIRKLLASSSFALVETFEVLKERLEKLYAGTKSAKANEGFELFWKYLDDEIDEDEFDKDDEDTVFLKQKIQEEIDEVDAIINSAKIIKQNAKIKALKQAIVAAFSMQKEKGIAEKVVIFTESKRTQAYIANELINTGYLDEDIVLFNGENSDEKTREIYKRYSIKNFGKTNYGPSVERKHAIVDYFEHSAKILILTDAGSEGLNLQFCNTVINYDLPWNPMKIEQRIGRCHRYGQKNDVVAINLLNITNTADSRVFEILSKKFELFEGVFGASDIALGILESGVNFEQEILRIYQQCNTSKEFMAEFDKLDRQLNAKRNKKALQLRSILLSKDSKDKIDDLDKVKKDIDKYCSQVDFWEKVEDEDILVDNISILHTPNWGEEILGCHGYIFIGAMCDNSNLLNPVLLLCDENGNYVDFDEEDLLPEIGKIDDYDLYPYKLDEKEQGYLNGIYEDLTQKMCQKYDENTNPIKEYNKKKVENWINIQIEQLNIHIAEMLEEISQLEYNCKEATEYLEKVDIKKKIAEKRKSLEKFQESFHQKVTSIGEEGMRSIQEFNDNFHINPILLIKIVLKF